jgi:hypothetical protein
VRSEDSARSEETGLDKAMTDITELVKRLRERSGQYDEYGWHSEIEIEAADALEAQSKAIAGLEYEARLFDEALGNAHARIAELEAEIAELREVLRETLAIAERNELGDYQSRASAALKGEK